MAVRLRLRWIADGFTGGRGAPVAVACWAGLAVLGFLALLFGQLLLLMFVGALVVLAIAFARAGRPSHWSHWLMVASVVVGVFAAAYVWWALGVGIDAADNMTPEPAAAGWMGEGLLLMLASAVGFLLATGIAVTRERRRRA